jgi:hypothetical protein
MISIEIRKELNHLEEIEEDQRKQIKRLKYNLYFNWSFTLILLLITNIYNT